MWHEDEEQSDYPELDLYTLMQMLSMFEPARDKKGNLEPYDIDAQRDYRNAYQDTITSAADLMNAYVAGPGAYAPEAFDPIIERELIETPNLDALRGRAGGSGYEAFLAELGLQGVDPSEAVATLKDAVQGIGVDPATAEALAATIPQWVDEATNKPRPNWDRVQQRAEKLLDPTYAEWNATEGAILAGSPNIERGEDGRYYRTTTTDSPVVEHHKGLGLPDPREQYDYGWALQNLPGAAEAQLGADAVVLESLREGQRRAALGDLVRQGMRAQQRETEAMARYGDPVRKHDLADRRAAARDRREARYAAEPAQPEVVAASDNWWDQPWESEFRQAWNPGVTSKATAAPRNEAIARVVHPAQRRPGSISGPTEQRAAHAGTRGQDVPTLQAMMRKAAENYQDRSRQLMSQYAANPQANPAVQYAMMERLRNQGRSPGKDAIEQRLAPLRAVGALGPRPWG